MKALLIAGIALLACCFTAHAQTACTDVQIPNVFTPNGDGFNDYFVITCLELYPDNELIIYNREGKIVYHAFNYHNSWQGTWDKTGGALPADTYVYVFIGKGNGPDVYKKGTLQLVL
ncbi:MAG: gliding motility-associated C-terminal domain-containing protein [Chitinophagales bacterium]